MSLSFPVWVTMKLFLQTCKNYHSEGKKTNYIYKMFFHVRFPVGDEVPQEYGFTWLYNGLADLYRDWIPDEDLESFRL